MRVCSVTGSTSIQRAQEANAHTIAAPTYTECVQRLLSGQVDAVTTDDAILLGYAARQPTKLYVVGKPFSIEEYGIGYKKGDRAFCQFLTDTINKALTNGAWEQAFNDTLGKAGVPSPARPNPRPCQP